MSRIIEKITEPTKIYVDSVFKLKIKIAPKSYKLSDVKAVTCEYLKNIKCQDLREGIL